MRRRVGLGWLAGLAGLGWAAVFCILYSVSCMQYTVFSMLYSVFSMQYTVFPLHCTALHYSTVHYTTLDYTTLHYTFLFSLTLLLSSLLSLECFPLSLLSAKMQKRVGLAWLAGLAGLGWAAVLCILHLVFSIQYSVCLYAVYSIFWDHLGSCQKVSRIIRDHLESSEIILSGIIWDLALDHLGSSGII